MEKVTIKDYIFVNHNAVNTNKQELILRVTLSDSYDEKITKYYFDIEEIDEAIKAYNFLNDKNIIRGKKYNYTKGSRILIKAARKCCTEEECYEFYQNEFKDDPEALEIISILWCNEFYRFPFSLTNNWSETLDDLRSLDIHAELFLKRNKKLYEYEKTI